MDHSIKFLLLKFMILVLENEGKSKYFMQSHAAAAFKNTLQLINESKEASNNFSETLFSFIYDDLDNDKVNQVTHNFHKAFRQRDMSDSGYLDMIVWNLLQIDDVFRNCDHIIKYLFEIVKDNKNLIKENEIEDDYLKRLVNDYELYFD